MPVYICYRGGCDNLAYQQPGRSPFVAKDALGRDWLCVETTLTEMPEFPSDNVIELMVAQGTAQSAGLEP